MGGPELFIVLLVVVIFVGFPIWGIIDAATRPDSEWAAADQNKIVWLLVQVFLWVIGSLVYFLAIRPKLSRHRHAT